MALKAAIEQVRRAMAISYLVETQELEALERWLDWCITLAQHEAKATPNIIHASPNQSNTKSSR